MNKESAIIQSRQTYLVPIVAGLAAAIALATVIYLERRHLAGWQLSAGQSHMWEIILKAGAGFLAISGALIAVLKYLDDKIHSTEIARREARKDLSVKQQEVYFRLLNATSTIGNEIKGTAVRIEAEKNFWRMYWGEIVMVEDPAVAVAVDAFSDALWDQPDNSVQLLNLSMNLARACRASLGDTWKVIQKGLPPSNNVEQKRSTPALTITEGIYGVGENEGR